MLEIQKQIIEHGLDAIVEKYSLSKRNHTKFPNLVLLKYDIGSPMGEKAVQQCRGIILDSTNNWEVVSRPFDKFFNLTEGHAAQIEWDSARTWEKLDGSLVPMYWYGGEWNFSTSGSPDAAGQVNELGFTFNDLIKQVWNELGYQYPQFIDMTYIFELCTKHNKIVVDYKGKNRLVLLGIRDRITGQEFQPTDQRFNNGYEVVQEFDFKSKKAILDNVETLNGIQSEGYVVSDAYFNRVKIKSPHYVTLHRLRGNHFNRKRALELVLLGETEEVLSYFPEWKEEIEHVEKVFNKFKEDTISIYEGIKHFESQKEFALDVKDLRLNSIYFAMRKGMSFDEAVRNIKLDSVYSALDLNR